MEKETIFTKIAKKEIPAYFIDENDEFMAFLDINPSVQGQTLVVPKVQRDSYVFNQDDEFMTRFWAYIKKITKLLDEKLGTLRCILIFEGFEVDHLHAKLYPILTKEQADNFDSRKKIEFNKEIAEELLSKLK